MPVAGGEPCDFDAKTLSQGCAPSDRGRL
jgi:hypothetical protein